MQSELRWSFESIIGQSPHSLFAHRLQEIELSPVQVYGLPAVGRLLAYWRLAFERVERDGPRCFGERFVSQSFDAFCRQPTATVKQIYSKLGMTMPDLDFGRVHAARPPFQTDSPHWQRYRELLNLPEV